MREKSLTIHERGGSAPTLQISYSKCFALMKKHRECYFAVPKEQEGLEFQNPQGSQEPQEPQSSFVYKSYRTPEPDNTMAARLLVQMSLVAKHGLNAEPSPAASESLNQRMEEAFSKRC